jgi:septum formation protein
MRIKTGQMIYLASASPRRHELLAQIGVSFTTVDIEVDESIHEGETPEDYVCRVALEKARAGLAVIRDRAINGHVLGADTAVIVDDEILGKPIDREMAASMLRKLSGKTHRVMSAVALAGGEEIVRLSISRVTFRELSDEEIKDYIATGEPLDKAGAYGIQGHASVFIPLLEGSYSGVMGLPLYETGELLKQSGVM